MAPLSPTHLEAVCLRVISLLLRYHIYSLRDATIHSFTHIMHFIFGVASLLKDSSHVFQTFAFRSSLANHFINTLDLYHQRLMFMQTLGLETELLATRYP